MTINLKTVMESLSPEEREIVEKKSADLIAEEMKLRDLLKAQETTQIKYHIDIYWSKTDNAFIAAVPELPGCMAEGATYEEVIKNVSVVIQEWIEVAKEIDRPIPDPVYGKISDRGLLVADSIDNTDVLKRATIPQSGCYTNDPVNRTE
jgi:predicted RNase H-like HicB family nuclease